MTRVVVAGSSIDVATPGAGPSRTIELAQGFRAGVFAATDLDGSHGVISGQWAALKSVVAEARRQVAEESVHPQSHVVATTYGLSPAATRAFVRGDRVLPTEGLRSLANFASTLLLEEFGSPAGSIAVSSACSSSISALDYVLMDSQLGRARRSVVLAYDFMATPEILECFRQFGVLQNMDSESMDGFTIGEAAACVVLDTVEKEESCVGEIELLGAATVSAAGSALAPQAETYIAACELLWRRSGYGADDVTDVCLHGSGTTYNSTAEATAILALFADAPRQHELKRTVGHTMAASGLVESVLILNQMDHGVLLKLTAGFGGTIGAALFRKH